LAALKYWVWLQILSGVPGQLKLELLHHFGSPEEVYFASEGDYLQVEGLRPDMAKLLDNKSLARAEKVLSDCAEDGQFIVTMDDALYPNRLRNIFDPPILLYGKGAMPLFDEEVAVAMVGTRSCTPYGIRAAQELGFELTKQGAMVVSGMAKGIDTAALQGALRAGGFTVAVLGGGADVIYPAENSRLYEDIAATGVILSEYPPHTEPEHWHFPIRNRVISGLSLATVVVEAPEDRSGALITAGTALEQGRDVFAVPGPFDARVSGGCHRLIRQGAALAASAWDILEEYVPRYPHKLRKNRETLPDLPAGAPVKKSGEEKKIEPEEKRKSISLPEENLPPEQEAILRQLKTEEAVLTDDIALALDLPVYQVLSALTMLELAGYIAKVGARSFVRIVDIYEEIEEVKA